MLVTERRDAVMLLGRCFVPGSQVACTEVEQTRRWVALLCPWEAEKEAGFTTEVGCCGSSRSSSGRLLGLGLPDLPCAAPCTPEMRALGWGALA